MTDLDITNLYQKWIELDRELKLLKQEVGLIKSTLEPKKQYLPQWEENLEPTKPAQWPNEPYTDYLKRIGEYNEAQVYEDDTK